MSYTLLSSLVLLQHGADYTLLNTDRKTPLDVANGQASEVLLGNNGNYNH